MLFTTTKEINTPCQASDFQFNANLLFSPFKVIEKVLVGLANYFYCTIKFLIFFYSNIELFSIAPY